MEQVEQVDKNVKKIMERVGNNGKPIYFQRVPPKTWEAFKKLADEEFCSDYGMVLKFLMDGIIGLNEQELLVRIELLEQKITELETLIKTTPTENRKVIKMCDGRKIIVR